AEHGRYDAELVHRRRDGTPIHVEVAAIAARNSAGARVGYVSVIRDITERKRSHALLENARYLLELEVQERTADLARVNQELEESLRGRDAFISIASHELRTP